MCFSPSLHAAQETEEVLSCTMEWLEALKPLVYEHAVLQQYLIPIIGAVELLSLVQKDVVATIHSLKMAPPVAS